MKTIGLTLATTLAAALFAAVAWMLPLPHAAAGEEKPLDAAMAAFKAGKYDEVVAAVEKVAETDPDLPKALYLLGEARLAKGDPERAIEAFQKVLAARPAAAPAVVGLGRCLAAQGEYEDAEKEFRRAVTLDEKDPGARLALGEHLLERGKTKDAQKELGAAQKLAPEDPAVNRALVEAHLRADDDKKALTVAKRFVKARKDHAMAHFLLGLVLDRQGEVKDAVAAYEKAVELDDRFLDAHKNLGILCVAGNPMYRDLAMAKKAVRHFERYFELGGKDQKLRSVTDTITSFLAEYLKGG